MEEKLIEQILVRLANAGRLPRMQSFDWQVLHGRQVENRLESGLGFLVDIRA